MKVTRIPASKLIPGRVYEYTVGRRTEATPVKYMLAVSYQPRTTLLGVDLETAKLITRMWVDVNDCVLVENHEFKFDTPAISSSTVSSMPDGTVFSCGTHCSPFLLKTQNNCIVELGSGLLTHLSEDPSNPINTGVFPAYGAELIIRD